MWKKWLYFVLRFLVCIAMMAYIGHKSKIAAPAKDTAIFIDTNLLG